MTGTGNYRKFEGVTVTYMPISRLEFAQLAPQLVDIYLQAMNYSRDMRDQRITVWQRDSTEPGFQAVIAHDGTHVLGVTYGHPGSHSHWWTQQIMRGVFETGGPSAAQREVLASFFELTEIHVAPQCQGMGIGTRLIQELLSLAGQRFVVLSTPEVPGEENSAFRLYRAFGFEDLLRNFVFRGDPRPFAILYAALPLSARLPAAER
ncbi:hypothetical protein B843_09020 [Corynebacterium vitaeruminis DSM 20294]|uniref:N-acetyltransferase domain-containing protein n=1 Tax=Corynebacterium vitaeruminis DSM 20294 TaxID=1224164 RepID=W5Y2P1_9CORY|nr:hypothetical protein B843_09020 [Corynebacterium vitaeruminis DSM 20294]